MRPDRRLLPWPALAVFVVFVWLCCYGKGGSGPHRPAGGNNDRRTASPPQAASPLSCQRHRANRIGSITTQQPLSVRRSCWTVRNGINLYLECYALISISLLFP